MFYVCDFGDGTPYETEEEAKEYIDEYLATYGHDLFDENLECCIPWGVLFNWASKQERFWDRFGYSYDMAFQAFAEDYIREED